MDFLLEEGRDRNGISISPSASLSWPGSRGAELVLSPVLAVSDIGPPGFPPQSLCLTTPFGSPVAFVSNFRVPTSSDLHPQIIPPSASRSTHDGRLTLHMRLCVGLYMHCPLKKRRLLGLRMRRRIDGGGGMIETSTSACPHLVTGFTLVRLQSSLSGTRLHCLD